MAKALVVLAHPLDKSLCSHFAETALGALLQAGHDATLLDLARTGFDPRLSAGERAGYYSPAADRPAAETGAVSREAALLTAAETLVLVFPVWWSAPPALMKGFFDRVFAPGIAFDHSKGFGPITPRLTGLRKVIAITTHGGPAWHDWLIIRRPLTRMLKHGLIKPCAPQASFRQLAFYSAENPGVERISGFAARIRAAVSG